MRLGTVMQSFQNETAATEALLALGDLVLLAEVDATRARFEEGLGEYIAGAVKRFERLASDEDWLRLMTALEKSDRPDAACLTTMLRWSIASDTAPTSSDGHACTCKGGDGGCHDHT